jgi:glutathione S-transferase
MSLTYYFHPMSQPSRAVLAFLKLTGIPFEPKVIDLPKQENKTPEYLKINPLGVVPSIDDAGFLLNESEAIVKYLINSRKVGEAYYPTEPQERALVDRYFPFHHSYLRPRTNSFFGATWPFLLKVNFQIEQTRPGAEEACKKLEEIFLKDTKYVAGDKLTIADLFCANELTQLYFTTDFNFTPFPKVKEYIERCLENPVINEVNQVPKRFPEFMKKMMASAPKTE